MASHDFIEKVKREVSLESYISRYVRLKRAGKRSLGLCPFHTEKSPSFSVSNDLQLYHCFGCGKSGDIFRFVQDYEKVDFKRSLEILSEYSGIPLDQFIRAEDQELKQKYYTLNENFLNYFKENLHGAGGSSAREYLKRRGIEKSSALKFELGFSLPGFDNFLRDLLRNEEWIQIAKTLGFLKASNSRNGFYDFYRERLMFPIRDSAGRVCGFGGRTIRDSEEAKYINSPASPIYDKGKMFYGLNLAQKSLRKERKAILVEGYLDVIGMHSRGRENTVAPLGTALTSNQIRALKNYVDSVSLIFDGDRAGRAAALRSGEICLREGLPAEIVVLPEGKDPFDLCMETNDNELGEILHKTISHSDFLLQETLQHANKSSSPDEKRKALENLFSFSKTLDKETDRQLYLSEGAKQLGLSISAVLHDFKKGTGLSLESQKVDTKKAGKPAKSNQNAVAIYSGKLLGMVLLYPELLRYSGELENLDWEDEESALLWEIIITRYGNDEKISQELLGEESIPEELRGRMVPVLMELKEFDLSAEDIQVQFEEFLLLLKRVNKQRELENVNSGVGVLDEKARLSKIISVKSEILEIDTKLRTLNYTNGRG